jgi:hypothetical protein
MARRRVEIRGDTAIPDPAVNIAPPPPPPAPRPQPSPGPSGWQRFEQMPRGQLEKALIVIGVLIMVYVGLWQMALALGFG